ncbi:hypothetical protein ESCO_004318 [Escovopsis weberi]|uniref:Uncharacterized protein n=1 Tax=Escovopsis weberi TaxID=150374 RepID=A0A0M8N637_ESCWE|nr:hypothetical protein ESCO_004318 [Escovopsis weberi]
MSKQTPAAAVYASRGRGGAGNMADASQSTTLKPEDLETPTLKLPVVTTGRGGTGNMARNNDPRETRMWQDVQAIPRRLSSGAQHAGRGGAGNVFMGDEEAEALAKQCLSDREHAIDDQPDKGDKSDKCEKADKAEKVEKLEKIEEQAAKKGHWLWGPW